MQKLGSVSISAGVINYNGVGVIEDTLQSIIDCGYPDIDILVVDDGSTDGSVERIREKFPNVRVFPQPKNMGPNSARNRVLGEAKHDIVFVTDNDVTLEKNTLELLVETIVADENVGAVTPMVLDAVDKTRVYANYVTLHYACFGIIPDRHKQLGEEVDLAVGQSVCGSGGIMLTKKSVAEELGFFDEDFIFGYDDGEYTYRITASGRKVMQVPSARIYHIEKPGRGVGRLRYQIRGRWHFILKHYSARALFLLAPALLFFEMGNLGYLLLKGGLGEWLRGIAMILSGFGGIMEKRKRVQAMKKRPDKELLRGGEIFMFPSRLGTAFVIIKKIFETLLNGYWAMVGPLLTK